MAPLNWESLSEGRISYARGHPYTAFTPLRTMCAAALSQTIGSSVGLCQLLPPLVRSRLGGHGESALLFTAREIPTKKK